MPRPIRIVAKKTPRSRSSREPSLRRPNPLLTFGLVSHKWIYTVFRSIDPPARQMNISKRTFLTRIFTGLKSLNSGFLNALRIPKLLISVQNTMGTIDTIEEAIVIVAFTV